MTIGILSSVKYHPKMQKAFEDGFVSFPAALPAMPPPQDDVGFHPDDLDQAIQNLLAVAGPPRGEYDCHVWRGSSVQKHDCEQ
jgi:hypothetical protein